MTTGWVRRRGHLNAGALVVLASLACIGSVGAARIVPSESAFNLTDPAAGTRATLLPGFAAILDSATDETFVRVVGHDIDNDGDFDIVANNGTLDLVVWQNDGAGHFARKSPARHRTGLQSELPDSIIRDSVVSSSDVNSDDDGHDLQPESLHSSIVTTPGIHPPATVHGLIQQARPSVRSPRAPPLNLSL